MTQPIFIASLQHFAQEAPAVQEEARTPEGAEGPSLYEVWMEQAEQTKAMYPGFDLDAQMADPRFLNLLKAQVDIRTAYEVLHQDQLIPAAMAYAARAVEDKLTRRMSSQAQRPAENASNPQGAALVRADVSRMSRQERQEIIRRVQRGERISF